MEALIAGRAGFETLGSNYPPAAGVSSENTSIAGMPCTWFRPAGAKENDIVVYIHGGAFIYGSVRSHAALVSHIASALNRSILFIDYRLAPEHPFPSGLNDCVAVISAFFSEQPGLHFGMIGDSAGGNITIASQLKLKETEGPMPRYSIVISPWADLECKNASYTRNAAADTILNQPYLEWAAGLYANGSKLSDPLVSPVNADLSGLPPALILCGSDEILEDDSVHLHRQYLAAGIDAGLIIFDSEQHVWPFMDIASPAAQEALAAFAAFAGKHSPGRLPPAP